MRINTNSLIPNSSVLKIGCKPDDISKINKATYEYLYKRRKSIINVIELTYFIIGQFQKFSTSKSILSINFDISKLVLQQHMHKIFGNASKFKITHIYKDVSYYVTFEPVYKNSFASKLLGF